LLLGITVDNRKSDSQDPKKQVQQALQKTPTPKYVDHYITLANPTYYLQFNQQYD